MICQFLSPPADLEGASRLHSLAQFPEKSGIFFGAVTEELDPETRYAGSYIRNLNQVNHLRNFKNHILQDLNNGQNSAESIAQSNTIIREIIEQRGLDKLKDFFSRISEERKAQLIALNNGAVFKKFITSAIDSNNSDALKEVFKILGDQNSKSLIGAVFEEIEARIDPKKSESINVLISALASNPTNQEMLDRISSNPLTPDKSKIFLEIIGDAPSQSAQNTSQANNISVANAKLKDLRDDLSRRFTAIGHSPDQSIATSNLIIREILEEENLKQLKNISENINFANIGVETLKTEVATMLIQNPDSQKSQRHKNQKKLFADLSEKEVLILGDTLLDLFGRKRMNEIAEKKYDQLKPSGSPKDPNISEQAIENVR